MSILSAARQVAGSGKVEVQLRVAVVVLLADEREGRLARAGVRGFEAKGTVRVAVRGRGIGV